jgi:hypothetical protein
MMSGNVIYRGRNLVLASALGLSVAVPARAEGDAKAECAAAYTASQEHRAGGQLLEAHAALVRCAQPECPAFIESDCGRWLIEVDRETPTIVIAAKGRDGRDTTDVRVFMDGEPFLEQVTGQAVSLDPGPHTLRFEVGNAEPIERAVVLRMGQKNRSVDIDFSGGTASESSQPPFEEAAEVDETPRKPGPLRPYAFVAGGVGGLGLAGWAVFSLLGKSQESDLEKSCSPGCADSDVKQVRTKYLIANISLGVGVAGLAAGTALFFISQPKAPSQTAWSVGVGPAPGGALGAVSGAF